MRMRLPTVAAFEGAFDNKTIVSEVGIVPNLPAHRVSTRIAAVTYVVSTGLPMDFAALRFRGVGVHTVTCGANLRVGDDRLPSGQTL